MERWTAAEVLAASQGLDEAWLPSGIEEVRTDDCLVLCRPVHLSSPGSSRVQASIKSPWPFLEIRPEVERLAQAWGTDEVLWRADGEIAPVANESLRSAGASLAFDRTGHGPGAPRDRRRRMVGRREPRGSVKEPRRGRGDLRRARRSGDH